MRFILLFSLLFSLSGCVMAELIDKQIEKAESAPRKPTKEEIAKAKADALKPGADMKAFNSVWGEPKKTDYYDSTYESDYGTLTVFHRDGKIVGWRNK